MSLRPIRKETTFTSSGDVIAMPWVAEVSSSQSPFSARVVNQVLQHQQFQVSVKDMVEASVAEYLLRRMAAEPEKIDDPFGSIYLSELLPDRISNNDIVEIHAYANVVDLSSNINFDDGMDD